MKIQKKHRTPLLIFSTGIVFIIIAIVNQRIIGYKIKENEYETIAQILKVTDSRTVTRVYYHFYFDGEKINSNETTNHNVKNLIGHYFVVSVSKENASYSRIQLDREVTDTVRIRAAGFKPITSSD